MLTGGRPTSERACVAARIVEHARWLVGGAEMTPRERERIGELVAEYDRYERTMRAALGCKP